MRRRRVQATWRDVLQASRVYSGTPASLISANRRTLGWTVFQLVSDIADYISPHFRVEFALHSTQSNTNNVAVMQFAAEIIAQLEPEIVHQINIFRPKTGWVRT